MTMAIDSFNGRSLEDARAYRWPPRPTADSFG